MHRKRIIAVLLLIIATIITIATAFKTGINPPAANVAGSFGTILFLLATAKILDVKDDLFYCGVIFVYLASPIGSVLDLYRRFGPYDKIIHFIIEGRGVNLLTIIHKNKYYAEKQTEIFGFEKIYKSD